MTPPSPETPATTQPRAVCVFCGSSPRVDPEYLATAATVGRGLAERGLRLVYGGASIGLMGALADAALASGGEVVGVIPESLAVREVAHTGLTELRVTSSMHARKALMAELSGAFVALPGGLGTFDELLEILSWSQLGIHDKPIGLLNVAGFYDGLIGLLDRAVHDQFARPEHRQLLFVATEPEELLDGLASHRPRRLPKWVPRVRA
jgi:uncharacterized protein (TIGR00730 family)